MQQFCTYGSVRGALGNRRPYRDNNPVGSRSHDLVRERGARRSRCGFISDDEQQSYRAKSWLPKGLRRRRAIALSQLLSDVPHRLRRCVALLLRRRSQRDPRDYYRGLLVFW